MTEEELALLCHRVVEHVPGPSQDIVEAAIDSARRRARRRRAEQLLAVAVVAAVIGGTVTAVASKVPGRPPTASSYAFHGFGVGADDPAGALARLLPPSGDIVLPRNGTMPDWLTSAMHDVGFPGGVMIVGPGSDSRVGTVLYRRGGRQAAVSVVVQPMVRETALSDLSTACTRDHTLCSETVAGRLIVQEHEAAAPGPVIVTLLAKGGWLVQIATTDDTVVPAQTLVQIAMDAVWLR